MLRRMWGLVLIAAFSCGGERTAETPPAQAAAPPAQTAAPPQTRSVLGAPVAESGPPEASSGDPLLGVPQTAPDLQVTDLDGTSWSLAEMKAKGPVVLILYKTGCPATKLAMPVFNRFRELYGDEGYSILALAQDTPTDTERFRADMKLNYPQAVDAEPYAISSSYNVRFTPTMALIAPDGQVKKVCTGWHRDGANEVAQELASLLGREYQPLSEAGDGLPSRKPG